MMPGKITWSKVAKVLREEFMEGLRCKLCGEEIEEGENALKTLNNIYKHYKQKHPETIEKIKQKLTTPKQTV